MPIYIAPMFSPIQTILQDIYVNSISGISSTVLGYLTTITENVQDALNYLQGNINEILRKTANYNYYDTYDMTEITSNLKVDRLAVKGNINASNIAVSGTLNAYQINNQM